jgi:hypothetical protein
MNVTFQKDALYTVMILKRKNQLYLRLTRYKSKQIYGTRNKGHMHKNLRFPLLTSSLENLMKLNYPPFLAEVDKNMNTPALPTFPLLPLRWWEHPAYIGALAIALVILVIISIGAWYTYHKRKNKPLSTYDRWLYEISLIQTDPPSIIPRAYSELMRIIREYAYQHLPAISETCTDEEFVEQLHMHKARIPSGFLELVEPIKAEAYSTKFAHEQTSPQQVQKHIAQVAHFLRKHQL